MPEKIEIVGTTRDTDCERFLWWEIGNNDYSLMITNHTSNRDNEVDGNTMSLYSFEYFDPLRQINTGSGLPPSIYVHQIMPYAT